jgi:hypothetical protein
LQRNTLDKRIVPGPGSYENNRYVSRSVPKYSFGVKTNSKNSNKLFTPGPGTYNPRTPISRIEYTMRSRTGNKMPKIRSQIVGPGAYEVPDVITKPQSRVLFSKSKRFKSKKKLNLIGPGSYKPKIMRNTFAYSMRPKTKWSDIKNKNPGPGQYFPKVDLLHKKCQLAFFGKDKRGKENKKTFKNVGPGSYNPSNIKLNIGYSFGKNRRYEDYSKFKHTPGPGYYNIKSFLESYPAYATWNIK